MCSTVRELTRLVPAGFFSMLLLMNQALAQDFASCRTKSSDLQRLVCYDALTGGMDEAVPSHLVPSGAIRPFPNCAAARAVGAAPVMIGDPGYSRRLDRDGDGIGCE
jgi:hypothetical protein